MGQVGGETGDVVCRRGLQSLVTVKEEMCARTKRASSHACKAVSTLLAQIHCMVV